MRHIHQVCADSDKFNVKFSKIRFFCEFQKLVQYSLTRLLIRHSRLFEKIFEILYLGFVKLKKFLVKILKKFIKEMFKSASKLLSVL